MTQQRSEHTREQIMTAAISRFCQSGYDATSVAEICTQADVSKGAFYHHFPSKKALFLAIMDQWLQAVNSRLGAFRDPDKTVPQTLRDMTAAMGSIFTDAHGQLPMFMEFMVQASRDQAIWDATIAPYRTYQGQFAQMLAEGKKEGSIQSAVDEQTAAWMLIAFFVGVFLQGVVMPEITDWNDVAQKGVNMLMESMQRSKK
jgi:AcrR family transcriptional regulator